MRWLWIILFAITTPAIAQIPASVMQNMQKAASIPNAAAPPSNFNATMWQDFEFGTVSTGNLDAHDHTSSGSWTLSDGAGNFSTSTSGQFTSLSTINSTTDTGTNGLAYNYTAGSASYLYWNGAWGSAAGSLGFWYKIPTFTGNFGAFDFASVWSGSRTISLDIKRVSGVVTVYLSSDSDGATSSALTEGNWYYFTMLFQRSATCSCNIYTSSGTAIATQPASVTGRAQDANLAIVGVVNGTPPAQAVTAYYDNFVADSSATFPLGP